MVCIPGLAFVRAIPSLLKLRGTAFTGLRAIASNSMGQTRAHPGRDLSLISWSRQYVLLMRIVYSTSPEC
jgi:hypothetical protein